MRDLFLFIFFLKRTSKPQPKPKFFLFFVKNQMMDSHLDLLSETQGKVLDLIENGKNVTVQANPGSGKTHLILQIASAFPSKNVLVVSFNTALVNDTNTKLQKFAHERSGWTAAHTYHGLMGTIVGETVYDDMIFGHFLTSTNFEQIGPTWKYRDVELFIIDEAQDLKERLVLLLLIIITSMASNRDALQVVFLFDDKQTLYSFYPISKADARFAILASNIYGPFLSDQTFEHVVLPVSYRLTPQSTDFINALVPSRTIISGHTQEELHNYVTLYVADIYRDAAAIVVDIVRREAGTRYNYGDILILVNSLRSKHSPARAVVDMLVANNIPVHVLRNTKTIHSENAEQEAPQYGDVRKNKVNCLTDCGAKGLQFRIVIKINESELLSPEFITSPRFVSITRHSERLYLIQSSRKTTQAQIDNLLSTPSITQRVLRLIVKREVPIDLPVKKQELNTTNVITTISLPSVVECSALFTFLDIVHMENLMAHLEYERLSPDEFDPAHGSSSSEQTCGFLDQSEVGQYIAMNVIAQKNNNTFVDVMRIVNRALMFAIEFYFSKRIPSCISMIAKKTQYSENSVQDRVMWNRLQDPLFDVTRLHDDNPDVFFQRIIDSMEMFGIFAMVHDAYESYRDLLFELNDFKFVCTKQVTDRLRKLRVILQNLISRHEQLTEQKAGPLQWDQLITGHFVLEQTQLLDLVAHVPIMSKDHSFYVYVSSEADISNDDRLCAMAATMATQTVVSSMTTNVFLISLVTLAVEHIQLMSPLQQPQILNVEPNKAIVRYEACEFLSEAISYKFWNSNENDESETQEQVITTKRSRSKHDDDVQHEHDETTFVTNIHNSLQSITKKQKTSRV